MAIDSIVGSGRDMDAYYKNLIPSKNILPIMVYSHMSNFRRAPVWIKNKIVFDMPYATHPLELCSPEFCHLDPDHHITHKQWLDKFVSAIRFIKKMYGNHEIWLLDMILPKIEKPMGGNIVQVFHGELFKIGPLSYFKNENLPSLNRYGRILLSSRLLYDEVVRYGKFNSHDNRLRLTGRVLNDTLYSGVLDKNDVMMQYKLNPDKKTLLYAPSWESLKIWPIGKRGDDAANLFKFCQFLQKLKLNFIFRPHPICILQYGVKPEIMRVLQQFKHTYFDDSSISSYLGPNKTLIAADIMITDLSTISGDFLSLNKPVIFFYPDNKQGLWGEFFPNFDEVANISYAVKNFPELYTAIKKLVLHKEPDNILSKRIKTIEYLQEKRDGSAGKIFLSEMENYAQEIFSKEASFAQQFNLFLNKIFNRQDDSLVYFSAQITDTP
jgi:hypothetical protein